MALWPSCLDAGVDLIEKKQYHRELENFLPNFKEFSAYELLYLNWVAQSLQFTVDNHFDFLEIIIESPLNANEKMIKAFETICNQFKFPKTIHAPFLFGNIISGDYFVRRASIDEVKAIFEIAKKIRARTVTIHPGSPKPPVKFLSDYYKKAFIDSVKEIGDYYHEKFQYVFNLSMENMPKQENIFGKHEEIVKFYQTPLFQDFKFTLDSSHGWTNGGDDYLIAFIKAMKEKLCHIHLVDNDTFDNDPHIEIGQGKINFDNVIKTLVEIGYQNTMIVEIPGIKRTLNSQAVIKKLLETYHA